MNFTINIIEEITFSVENIENHGRKMKGAPGVYILLSEHEHPLYVGKSKDVYRRLLEHRKSSKFFKDVEHIEVKTTSNVSEADIIETILINEIKPVYNIDKASYSEFIREQEEQLAEKEFEIEELTKRILELEEEISAEYCGFCSIAKEEIAQMNERIDELKNEVSTLKRRGAKSLENKTVQELIENEKRRKSAAFLASR